MPHIVVAGKLHAAGLALLDQAAGVSYDYVPDADPSAYLKVLPRAEGLVLRTQPLRVADVAAAPHLQIVSRHGVGYDAVDTAALAARGIPLAIVGDVNSRTVAEHAMMLLLAASRRLVKSAAALRAGDWAYRNAFEPQEIDGKTLLIIGYGRIGRRLAELADVFGMRVLAYDPFVPEGGFDGAKRVAVLADALPEADCVSLHMPKSNAPVLGAGELDLLPDHAVLVNTARGGLIDEAALLQRLQRGEIGAVGFDVLTEEPPGADHPFLGLQNAIITPHSAGLTEECAARMARVSVQNVLDYFAGQLDPALCVNLVK